MNYYYYYYYLTAIELAKFIIINFFKVITTLHRSLSNDEQYSKLCITFADSLIYPEIYPWHKV